MNEPSHILIIEDDADINGIISSYLEKQGFVCTQAFSGSEAKLLLESGNRSATPFDVVITDLMLPGMSGQELVSLIRQEGHLPIIVISALDSPSQKIDLFQMGADDYLVKPFDLDELLARVYVQLRHVSKSSRETNRGVTFKDWCVDSDARSLCVRGETVKLTRTEYDIIETMVGRPKKVFSKRELYEAVWNEDCFIEEKAINVHVSNIRSKLKDSGTDCYIETVWGIGFKLTDA